MQKTKPYWLIIILLVAALLRLWGLDRGDTINDEVFYAFRAVGLLDFDKAEAQKTPLEWFDSRTNPESSGIPWWASLSFHDHPPLVFWIQFIFIKIFGESVWAFRLPSALFGIASVYLVYLLGLSLGGEAAKWPALLSAAIFAVTLNNVYISHTGMQEPYVLFFLLLSIYFLLRSFESDKYLIWLGASFGLGMLAKYTTIILVPIVFTAFLIWKRDYFLNKKLWLGALLAILIMSPVIIYNAMLYREAGHFDFQLSYIFGQNPSEWQSAPGKEIGSFAERIKVFIPRLIHTNSWVFLTLFVISLVFLRNAFLFLVLGFLFLFLLLIGPSHRFLTMLTPFMALALGGSAAKWRLSRLLWLTPILLFEIFYSYNNQIAYYPVGREPWLASRVRYDNYNWGYNDLGAYLEKELSGKMPSLTFQNKYKFIEDIQNKNLARAEAGGAEPYPAMFILYGNFDEGGRLWTLERLHFYHGWPVINFATYVDYLRQNGANYYKKSGFQNYYFIMPTNIVPEQEFLFFVKDAETIYIKNKKGDTAFKVFKISERIKVRIGGVEINAELADTPQEREKGLSGKSGLAADDGMLFIFPEPGLYQFWMSDLTFPIDIIWIGDNKKIIGVSANARPLKNMLNPTYYNPPNPVKYVLEAPAGFFELNRLKVGDAVEF